MSVETIERKEINGNGRLEILPEKTKAKNYGWTIVDNPGWFLRIPKNLLNIDHIYQRDKIVKSVIDQIVSDWSWLSCGCLTVVRRRDGTYWVIDGQHRKIAADRRDDINELPCMVFDDMEIQHEAAGFDRSNSIRTKLSTFQRFKSKLAANDPIAVGVNRMILESGYRIMNSPTNGNFSVNCIDFLLNEYERDETTLRMCWKLAVDIHAGETINGHILKGMVYLQRWMIRRGIGLLVDDKNRERLLSVGLKAIADKLVSVRQYHDQGGAKVYAEALIIILNHNRKKRIPSIMDDRLITKSDEQDIVEETA